MSYHHHKHRTHHLYFHRNRKHHLGYLLRIHNPDQLHQVLDRHNSSLIEHKDNLYQKLKEKGISTSVHFIPIHKHPYYKNRFSFRNRDYPVSNTVYEQSLSLPIYPGLSEKEVNYIIKYVVQYAE